MFHKLYQEIKDTIKQKIPSAEVIIYDPFSDGAHLEAVVVSKEFEGMPLLAQHRLVKEALYHILKDRLHALSLKTFTPQKWENEKAKYLLKKEDVWT